MKITVIGGGPGGLYFSLLAKKHRPEFEIDVYEQNNPDDTFGFGVVFSDETLDEFLSADPESYELIKEHFAYWSDIVVHHEGNRTVIGGNGFAGCSRLTLLQILQKRCTQVGVRLHFGTAVQIDQLEEQFADSDIIVAADGINSPIRERYSEEFGRTIEARKNYFTWVGSTRPLDAFTFFFKKNQQGVFCAHTYQYQAGRSTWVIEVTPETFQKCGFAHMDDDQTARYLEGIFADELEGHPLITNRSIWRQFPRIRCQHWSTGKIAILGDAKASAHWSIGSGTKLAMECAMGLSQAVLENEQDVQQAFKRYEELRRTPVEIIQHTADISLRWFENMERHWDMQQYEFCFALMSRGKSITWDNVKLRDPEFLEKVESEFYQRHHAETDFDCTNTHPTPMFTPIRLRGMVVENRVVVSPMAQYSAVNGVPDEWHLVHYGSRAIGGAGLIVTEMTCPAPDARITDGCTGLWNEEQEVAWKKIVDFIHQKSNAKFCLQLGHAGRKGSTRIPAQGADLPMEAGNWPIFSASPIPYIESVSEIPGELRREQMDEIVAAFVEAARRADRAGFDMLELHCAHGYLLASFLSPLTNQRTDEFGGDISNRLKFPLRVFNEIRNVWPEKKPMSIRISAWDWAAGGLSWDDLTAIGVAFKEAGIDVVDVSTGETVKWQTPVFGRMWQLPFAEFLRNEVGLRTITVGAITSGEQINTIIAARRADLCALARPHLNNPNFTRQEAGRYGVKVDGWPEQYRSGELQLYRESEKAAEKAFDLALKAKPNRHNYVKAAEK